MTKPLFLSALLSLPLAAQVPFFTPTSLRSGVGGSSVTRMADVNGDQLPDLLFYRSYNNGSNNVYQLECQLNIGNNLFGPEIIVDTFFYDVRAIELADLDGDQRPDLVAGSGSDSSYGIRIYHNTGSGFTQTQSFPGFNTNSLVLADIDKDGDKDLVYCSTIGTSYTVKWRANNGSGQFGAEQAVSSGTSTLQLNVADVDKDGDLDVIALQSSAKTIAWYPNNGSGVFGAARSIEGNLASMSFSDIADADNDGDVDLVVTAGTQGYLYRNSGSGSFTRSTVASSIGNMENIRFVRGDADVLPDLFYEANTVLTYNRNLGGGSFGSAQAVPRSGTSFNTNELLVVDYDKDGREDVISTEFYSGGVWFHRNATGSLPNIVSFGATDNTVDAGASATLTWNVEGATTIKINGNVVSGTSLVVTPGQYDATYTLTATNAAGTKTAGTTVFVPDTVFAGQATLLNTAFSSITNLDIGDINGDGKADIAFVNPGSGQLGLRIAGAGAGGGFGGELIIDSQMEAADGVLLVDIDKDGDKDLIAGFRYGAKLYRNNGSGQFAPPVLIDNRRATGIKQADFNGDGWPDLLLIERYNEPTRVVLNDGQGNLLPAVIATTRTACDALAADVNNDGLPDLLTVSLYNELQLYRSTGPMTWGPGEPLTTYVSFNGGLYFEDINGDGFGDLLFQSSSGGEGVMIMFGRAGGGFVPTITTLKVKDLYGFTVGDFDGDHDLDIGFVTRSTSTAPNAAGWMEGDGFGKFSEPFIIPASPTESYIALARDMDGDKDLDLVSMGSNKILWNRNVTEYATVPAIDKFDATYPVIHRGESLNLSWAVTGDRYLSVSISGIGVVTGSSINISPTETTTYILTATNRGGTVTKEFTVTVVDRPVIHSFTTDKNYLDRGTRVNLSWVAPGADQFSISPGIGPVTGNTVAATFYTTTNLVLTATNQYGSDTMLLPIAVYPAFYRFAATVPTPSNMPTPNVIQTADFDLDGRPDIVAGAGSSTPTGRIYWHRGTASGPAAAQIIQSNNSYGAYDITTADLDGDGRPDFASVSGALSGSSSGSWLQWFKLLPGGTWQATTIEATDTIRLGSIQAVDWDMDGDIDLVATARLNSVSQVAVWFQNLGGGNFAPRATLGGTFDQVGRITCADLDGDHDPDLVLARSGGPGDLFALINGGNGTVVEQRVLIPRSGVFSFDLGDLDGDNDIDIVACSANQYRCERFLNDGTGHFGPGALVFPQQNSMFGVRLGDVDSDGDLDVVSLNSILTWSENLGDGSFLAENPSPAPQRGVSDSPVLGDFDGDGDLDAFGKTTALNSQQDWFENLSTPPSGPPVIAEFSASETTVPAGKPVELHWRVSGFPTSLEMVPAALGTPLLPTQRGATVKPAATQTYTLIARNGKGETRRDLVIHVGQAPVIHSFTHSLDEVNQGQRTTLAWDIENADQIVINGNVDVTGISEFSVVVSTAPLATYQIVATNSTGSSSASVTVAVNRPPVASALTPTVADEDGTPIEVETAGAFSDPDANEHFTWTLAGNTRPELFSSVTVDPATGKLTASFADYFDGESLLTIRATDHNGLYADTTLPVALTQVPDPTLEPGSAVVSKREDGSFEQTLTVTNTGARAIGGFRIEIRGLPEGVSVSGAETPAAGKPWVLIHHEAVAAGASVDVKIEYVSTDSELEGFTPQVTVIQLAQPDETPAPDGQAFKISSMIWHEGGPVFLEWDVIPGHHYAVEYSSLETPAAWTRSPIIVSSATSRLQWIDQGLPKTETPPATQRARFYRVVELDEP